MGAGITASPSPALAPVPAAPQRPCVPGPGPPKRPGQLRLRGSAVTVAVCEVEEAVLYTRPETGAGADLAVTTATGGTWAMGTL